MLTCGVWVKRGVAKENPDKVTLTQEDLKQLVEETKSKIKDVEGNDDIDLDADISFGKHENTSDGESDLENNEDDRGEGNGIDNDSDDAIKEEYELGDYDKEGAVMTGAGMTGLLYFGSNEEDPYITMKNSDDEEHEDNTIKKNDNLFVVGKMEEDYTSLDIYVYNEEEESLYVHHDVLLESFPLCLEWLSFDPAAVTKPGNFLAVGTMEPDIQIWDLDIVDTLEPAFVLGGQKKKKKKKKKGKSDSAGSLTGHSDAVLSLSWNPNMTKVLASASADKTILLWDLAQCACVHSLTHHTDKVQSISWHPVEAQSLLSGSFDKTAAVLDCRSPEVFKSWSLSGECEQVLWDHFSPYHFFVSTDDGVVSYFDVRTETPVFTLHAHDKEVTGISLSKKVPGCLTTVSADEALKVWDYKDDKPYCVLSRDMKMGGINFVTACPDVGLTYALGGLKDGLRMLNLLETTQGKQHFLSVPPAKTNGAFSKSNDKKNPLGDNQMETEHAVEALATLSLKKNGEKQNVIIKKKKKKKK